MNTSRHVLELGLLTVSVVAIAIIPAAAERGQRADQRAAAITVAHTSESRVTSIQLERLTARLQTAARIIDRVESEALRRGFPIGWQQSTLLRLVPLSLEAMAQIEERVSSLDALADALHDAHSGSANAAVNDPQALGSSNSDLVYTPIAPCRFIDTRNVGGKINGVREFRLDFSGAAYGGSGGCDLPALFGTTPQLFGGLALNITIVDTSTAGTPGFVAVKPVAAAPVTSLLNWYEAGAQVQLANQGIVTINQEAGTPSGFVIQTSGAVHVVADVFGAFIAPAATPLLITQVVASANIGPGESATRDSPACPVNTALVSGSCVGADGLQLWTSAKVGNVWRCRYLSNSGVIQTFSAIATCARVP